MPAISRTWRIPRSLTQRWRNSWPDLHLTLEWFSFCAPGRGKDGGAICYSSLTMNLSEIVSSTAITNVPAMPSMPAL